MQQIIHRDKPAMLQRTAQAVSIRSMADRPLLCGDDGHDAVCIDSTDTDTDRITMGIVSEALR